LELDQLKIDRDPIANGPRRKRMGGWTKFLIVAVVVGAIVTLFRAPLRDFLARMSTPAVKVERVVQRNAATAAAASGTSANGYIVARTRAALSADTPGRIVEMNVEEGSVVKKGDVVARLYSDEYAAGLKQTQAEVAVAQAAKARAEADVVTVQKGMAALKSEVVVTEADIVQFEAALKLARQSLDRANSLLAGQVDTVDRVDRAQKDLDEATSRVAWARARREAAAEAVIEGEARVNAAQSAVKEADARITAALAARDLAQATLDKTAVRAPFDGIVVLKDAEVGEVVSPNSQGGSNARGSVVTMVDFASLEVQVDLQETSLSAAREGAAVSVYLDAWPDRRYTGRVRRVWPTANRQKATVEVRVAIEDPDEKLRPELGARVVFSSPSATSAATAAPEEAALVVARSAVVRVEGADGVFVLERDVARFRRVTLGPERAGRVVVKTGIAAGEQVIDDPPTSLDDGDRVRIKE
jgi:RND family efflux transporter MFP subunit